MKPKTGGRQKIKRACAANEPGSKGLLLPPLLWPRSWELGSLGLTGSLRLPLRCPHPPRRPVASKRRFRRESQIAPPLSQTSMWIIVSWTRGNPNPTGPETKTLNWRASIWVWTWVGTRSCDWVWSWYWIWYWELETELGATAPASGRHKSNSKHINLAKLFMQREKIGSYMILSHIYNYKIFIFYKIYHI